MAYLPLSTANLPDPAIDPAQDKEPRDYFETFLYTGNGGGLQVGDVIKKPADTTDISSSLIFDGSTSYLSHTTSGTSSGQDQITVSFWIKNWKPDTSTFNHIWSALQGGSDLCFYMALTTTHTIRFYFDETPSGSVGPTYFDTPMVFTDTSRWYHVHLKVDLNQSTTAEKYQVWIDGVQQTFSYTVQGGTQETNVDLFQNGTTHNIGRYIGNSSQHLGMYLAELHAVDGTAHEPTDFGNFDANGIWIPKAVTGITYGTNGFYLDFSDNTNTTTLGEDQTANGNDWTLNNFATTDQVSDSPTNNHMVMSPTNDYSNSTFSEGNLKLTTGTSEYGCALSSFILRDRGKYFCEITQGSGSYTQFGCASTAKAFTTTLGLGSGTDSFCYVQNDGSYRAGGGNDEAYGATWTSGDVIGMALNLDDHEVTFYKNGASQGTLSILQSNRNLNEDTQYYVAISDNDGSSGTTCTFNFGQKTFYGTDGSGTLPTGFTAISENNITVDDQNLESPDFVWIKNRDAADSHQLYDSVRGVQKVLISDDTPAEADAPNGLLDFNANGFTIGSQNEVNTSGEDYVAWCWKAPTSFSNSAGENGATIASSGKVNTDAGFSIVSYVADGTNTGSVGHGLDQKPDIVIQKNISNTSDWLVLTDLVDGSNDYLLLNSTVAANSAAGGANATTFVSWDRPSGNNMICYAFHSVEGFSKFGSYTGGSDPFVYLGFEPAMIIFKRATGTATHWAIRDNVRKTYNPNRNTLYPSKTDLEYTGTAHDIDFLSNGFKIRNGDGLFDASATYIYAAWAKTPFKYGTGV